MKALYTDYIKKGIEIVPVIHLKDRMYYVSGGKDVNGVWHDCLTSSVTGVEKYVPRNEIVEALAKKIEPQPAKETKKETVTQLSLI